ncbi:uncharacterized protein LOC143024062 [Oratosquilla oratoria]|uniref:uncharacterized protein LOC143024062 n=1 Tax=Oratosquilla oratoria TaxID=337810 RepID=UPI003F75DEB6
MDDSGSCLFAIMKDSLSSEESSFEGFTDAQLQSHVKHELLDHDSIPFENIKRNLAAATLKTARDQVIPDLDRNLDGDSYKDDSDPSSVEQNQRTVRRGTKSLPLDDENCGVLIKDTSPHKRHSLDSSMKRKIETRELESHYYSNSQDVIIKDDYIGRFCQTEGIDVTWLESGASCDAHVTNGLLYELDEFAKKISWERFYVAMWILRLHNMPNVEPTDEDINKIHSTLKRRKALATTLSGNRMVEAKLNDFDNIIFTLPSVEASPCTRLLIKHEVKAEPEEMYVEHIGGRRHKVKNVRYRNDTFGEENERVFGVSGRGRQRKPSAKIMENLGLTDSGEITKKSRKKKDLQKSGSKKRQSLPEDDDDMSSDDGSNKHLDTTHGSDESGAESSESMPAPNEIGGIFKPLYKRHRRQVLFPNESIGFYSEALGITAEMLNSDKMYNIKINNGAIYELHYFYRYYKAPGTRLVRDIYRICGIIPEVSRLLVTQAKIGQLATKDWEKRLARNPTFGFMDFVFPRRTVQEPWDSYDSLEYKKPKVSDCSESDGESLQMDQASMSETSPEKSTNDTPKKLPKPKVMKRIPKPKQTTNTTELVKELDLFKELTDTRGMAGYVSRGDIVCLYHKWRQEKLRNTNEVFVTDLLKAVESLMRERGVAFQRIPVGALMSSSVKLYDEFFLQWAEDKDDAKTYLKEDWLEDIKYLCFVAKSSRKSSVEGDASSISPDRCESEGEVHPHNSESENMGNFPRTAQSESQDAVLTGRSENQLVQPRVDASIKGKNKRAVTENEKENKEYMEKPSGVNKDDSALSKRKLKNEGNVHSKKIRNEHLDISFSDQGNKLSDKKPKAIPSIEKESTKPMGGIRTGEEYEIEKLLDMKCVNIGGKLVRHFKIRWKGYESEEDQWVEESDIDATGLIENFMKTHKNGKVKSDPVSPGKALDAVTEAAKVREEFALTRRLLVPVLKAQKGSLAALETMYFNKSLPKVKKTKGARVTVREVLELYDVWRKDNSNSGTLNVDNLISEVKQLLKYRGIDDEGLHGSILGACLMMNLAKMQKKCDKEKNEILDRDCRDFLVAVKSHKEQIREKITSTSKEAEQDSDLVKNTGPSSVAENILRLRQLVSQLHKSLKRAKQNKEITVSKLDAMRIEMEKLQTLTSKAKGDKKNYYALLEEELKNLKEELNQIEEENYNDVANLKQEKEEIELEDKDTHRVKGNALYVGKELMKSGVPASNLVNVIKSVVCKIGNNSVKQIDNPEDFAKQMALASDQ